MTRFRQSSCAAVLAAALLASSTPLAAQTLTTLHAFKGGANDGRSPVADLIFNRAGTTLYGTTQFGGAANKGSVFALDPTTGATTVLHSFANLGEGLFPQAGLAIDRAGALYGTTISIPESGGGAVFKLDPATNVFTVLHSFRGGSDGFFPSTPVTLDRKGDIFGTTLDGGGAGDTNNCPIFCGSVFRIDHKTGVLTILHAFTGFFDGAHPLSGLIPGPDGMYYGMTFSGGSAACGADAAGCGTVFKIDPVTGVLTTLHAFAGGAADGAFPLGKLVFDKAGILYGTTEGGGEKSSGTIFKLDPGTGAFSVLHTFTFFDGNGAFPNAGLTFNSAGTLLYGTTFFGGNDGCRNAGDAGCGTAFSFDPVTSAFTVLHKFTGSDDGGNPGAGLTLATNGLLYGTTTFDGVRNNGGTVFSLAP